MEVYDEMNMFSNFEMNRMFHLGLWSQDHKTEIIKDLGHILIK